MENTGMVTVTITGTSGSLTNTTTLTLTVNAAGQPLKYTLSASPSSVTMNQGGNGQSTITVTPQNGFSGNVTMSTSTLPSGVTAAFSPNPTSPTTNRSTLTLTASSTATTGTVTVTITGTSGSLTNTTTLTLTVNPQFFTLSVSTTMGLLASGTVTSSPAGINCGSNGSDCSTSYVSGTTVILTAHPGLLVGVQWTSGCDSVSGNTCTVNMNSARSVTVDFMLLGIL